MEGLLSTGPTPSSYLYVPSSKFFFNAWAYVKAIKLATKHNEVIFTICHGVRLALLTVFV